MDTTKGRAINVEMIETYLIKNKAIAWSMFITSEFLYNLKANDMSVVEAAKAVGQQLLDEVIIRKLTLRLHEKSLTYKLKNTTVHESLEDVVKVIKKNDDGTDSIPTDKLMEIMRDPVKVRTLKENAPPWLKEVFEDSRKNIYDQHDNDLKKIISDKYKLNLDDIKIDDFRTPGKDGIQNLNTDRDYRVLRKVKADDGSDVWIELQRRTWIKDSYDIFGQITGKPYDLDSKLWAERHLQRATDRFDVEACPDYSDHIFDNKTKQLLTNQPNILKVKEGNGTLIDAEKLGNMYQSKVQNAVESGTIPEAFAQAKKGVKTLKEVHESYKSQDLIDKKYEVPDKLKKALEIIEGTHSNADATPEYVNKVNEQLTALGYEDLKSVTKDMVEEFKKLKPFDQTDKVSAFFK